MTGRVLVTARCLRRGHPLGRVRASQDGLRIEVDQLAAGVSAATATGVGRGRGTAEFSGNFDPRMSYVATCDCGGGYLISCPALARAMESGQRRVKIAATM